ncbi:hypothetical protein GH721_08640 [Kriegella sp. EG-1]|nr:hypothetical protein [Flavobacteriaceae bacterium EG-1]
MKNILLPTDFSENASNAIEYAVRLFKNETCTFYILHAYIFAPSSAYTKISAEEDLNKIVTTLREKNDKNEHCFETIMVTETLLSTFSKTIIDYEIDCVVMGTKGTSAVREIFLGSNTMDIIRYVHSCPIIAIPPKFANKKLREILLATDFKHTFNNFELIPLKRITQLSNATLNIVHIKTKETLTNNQNSNKVLLRKALKNIRHQFFEVEPQGSITTTLNKLEKENSNIGMVALLKTTHGFFENLTREAVLKKMIYKTEVPLLVLPLIE